MPARLGKQHGAGAGRRPQEILRDTAMLLEKG